MNVVKKKINIVGSYSAYLILFSTFVGALFTVLLKDLTDELNIATIAFFRLSGSRGVAGCHPMSRPGDRLAYKIPS